MRQISRIIFILLACFLVTLALTSCRPNRVQPPRQVKLPDPDVDHMISPELENINIISVWYTGTTGNIQRIKDANPDVNFNRLKRGQVIKIPGDVVTNREFMTRNYIVNMKKQYKNNKKITDTATPKGKDPLIDETKKEDIKPTVDGEIREIPTPTPDQRPIATTTPEVKTPNVEIPQNPVVDTKPVPVATPKGDQKAPQSERDKLLDELLSQ